MAKGDAGKDSGKDSKSAKDKAIQDRFDKRWGSGKPTGPAPKGGQNPRKG
jgi:hypothetical protein